MHELRSAHAEPDIDIDSRTAVPALTPADAGTLQLRLRWAAALHGNLDGSVAITGGVRSADDVIKSIMVGADAVQMVSALLAGGPEALAATLKDEFRRAADMY